MDEQVGGRAILKDLRQNLPQMRDTLKELPAILRYLGRQASSHSNLKSESPDLQEIKKLIAKQQRHQKRTWLIVAAAMFISGGLALHFSTILELPLGLFTAGTLAAFIARP